MKTLVFLAIYKWGEYSLKYNIQNYEKFNKNFARSIFDAYIGELW